MTRLKKLLVHKMQGDMGVFSMILVIFMVITIHIFCRYAINCRYLRLDNTILTDGLEISNLSAPVIDQQTMEDVKFGSIVYDEARNEFVIKSTYGEEIDVVCVPEDTYNTFMELYDVNMTGSMCDSDISDMYVDNFTIYNVKSDNSVEVITYDEFGISTTQTITDGKGNIQSPNGVTITKTSIYSKVVFDYTDFFGIKHKDLNVDCCVAVRVMDR